MAEKKTTPVTIDGTEYQFEDMTEQQQLLVQHVHDLDRKLASARFNADQLQVGRDAFFAMLKDSLSNVEDAVESLQ